LVNIDAINPAWPRSIYLPDEEETLDKQVASGAVAARERGLVPQSGDWKKPKRWVRPEDADVPVDEGKKPRKKATVDLKDLNYLKNPRDVERYTENRKKGLEQLPKLFGDDFTVNDLQDIWSSGVDDYSTSITEIEEVPTISGMGVVKDGVVGEGALRIFITITHDPTLADSKKPQEKHEDYEIMYFPIAGIMDRVFQKDIDGNLNVHHTLFQLEPYHQKKGIASDMSEHVEEEYEKLGVHSISFYADADVGGYTWARQGYDFARTSDRANIKKHFRDTIRKNKHLFSNEELKSIAEDIKSFKHAWEFASLSIERDSIPHNLGKHLLLGSKWDAVKILDKKSPGYQIGKAYFAAKRNTTKRNTTITG